MLADIIAAQYKVIDDTKDASEMAMPCIAYGQIPANIGPGVFINRVYSMDSQSLSASQRYELFNGLATRAFTFFFSSRAGMAHSVLCLSVITVLPDSLISALSMTRC
nr:hypothetical protein [Escherichia coli]UGK56414.1 hypothetical protein [Escherichia coli]